MRNLTRRLGMIVGAILLLMLLALGQLPILIAFRAATQKFCKVDYSTDSGTMKAWNGMMP